MVGAPHPRQEHNSPKPFSTDPGAVIQPEPGEGHLDEEELADWCAGRDAVYQLAALTIGARLAIAGT
jgi:hypothetical protein